MAAKSPSWEEQVFSQFSAALFSAFSEWLLILLLLLDSFCIFVVSRMLSSTKLQTPCLLCTRFCYFFTNEKHKFCKDLVCDAHKLEISTLFYCHVHKNLADAGGMCESCLFSFAKNKFSLATCKFLLRKLIELDDDDRMLHTYADKMVNVPLLEKNHEDQSLHNLPCSCCSQPCNFKPHACKLFQYKSVLEDTPHPDIPLPISKRISRAHHPSRLRKPKEIASMQLTKYQSRDYDFDRLSHFGYKQLKFTSESESEVPFSYDNDDDGHSLDDVDGNSNKHGTNDIKEKSVVQEKIIHQNLLIVDSTFKSQLHEASSCIKSIVDASDVLGHGLEELDWSNVEAISKPPLLFQTTSRVEERSEVYTSSSKPGKVSDGSDYDLSIMQPLPQLPAWCDELCTDFVLIEQKGDDIKLSDTSSCNGLQTIIKGPDAEPYSFESADGSIGSEVEGEGIVDCLKRQTEMDRKFLTNLYMELEEERNASAIAAHQAMAMINKLQEEKAAMQLEVVQYLRMMEEQTEYEQEALQNLNEQLTEREKEINYLVAELDGYRKHYWDESLRYDSDGSEYSTTSTPRVMNPGKRDRCHVSHLKYFDETVLDFEDERDYISGCLKRLEVYAGLFGNTDDDRFRDEIYSNERSRHRVCSLTTIEENCASIENDDQMAERVSSGKHLSALSFSPTHELGSFIEGNDDRPNSSTNKSIDLLALGNEVEHLHARLEALEADRDFISHTINSLRSGQDGLQFVQEIATHLRELRRNGFMQKRQVFV